MMDTKTEHKYRAAIGALRRGYYVASGFGTDLAIRLGAIPREQQYVPAELVGTELTPVRPEEGEEVVWLRRHLREALLPYSIDGAIKLGIFAIDRTLRDPINIDECINYLLKSLTFIADKFGTDSAVRALSACVSNHLLRFKTISVVQMRSLDEYSIGDYTVVVPLEQLRERNDLMVHMQSDETIMHRHFIKLLYISERIECFSATVTSTQSISHFPKMNNESDDPYQLLRDAGTEASIRTNCDANRALSLAVGNPLVTELTWIIPDPEQVLVDHLLHHYSPYDPHLRPIVQPTPIMTAPLARQARAWFQGTFGCSEPEHTLTQPINCWMESSLDHGTLVSRVAKLAAALEQLYIPGQKHGLKEALSRECAKHLETGAPKQEQLRTLLEGFYQCRSGALHNNADFRNMKAWEVEEMVKAVQKVCARAILKHGQA